MDCKTANHLIQPFLRKELDLDRADEFMKHMKTCPDCREELEIYFTVREGIENMDKGDFMTFDLKGLFEERLKETQQMIRRRRLLGGFCSVMVTCAAAVLLMVTLRQLMIWF